jgi:hypothetical protein
MASRMTRIGLLATRRGCLALVVTYAAGATRELTTLQLGFFGVLHFLLRNQISRENLGLLGGGVVVGYSL